jgi:hypothetical protein
LEVVAVLVVLVIILAEQSQLYNQPTEGQAVVDTDSILQAQML